MSVFSPLSSHQGLFNNSNLHSTFLVATWSGTNCSTGWKNGKCLSRSAKLRHSDHRGHKLEQHSVHGSADPVTRTAKILKSFTAHFRRTQRAESRHEISPKSSLFHLL